MADYFQNPEDLGAWVQSRGSYDKAAKELLEMIGTEDNFPEVPDDEQDIMDSCQAIFNGQEDASQILFGVLAQHNITTLNKQAGSMKKETQSSSQDIWTALNWMERGTLEGILASVGIASNVRESDDELKQAIFENVQDGTLDVQSVLQSSSKGMKKEAQSASRQRNDWTRISRNKWNRSVDGYLDGTPWRIGRDKYYDFTHYATDEIKFDEDPEHIYSGESLWRTYVMDKFYRDYKDKDGHVVGGYINDRFHVFPTAGTPANPDVPRDGGNQLALPDGVRTRKPRPHQYSTERRLEEARGDKLESITCAAKDFEKVIKVASTQDFDDVMDDRIYNMFKDTVEMREASIDYEVILDAVASHYNASILGVAQVDKIAQKLIKKHAGIGYEAEIKTSMTLAEILETTGGGDDANTIQITDGRGAQAVLSGGDNSVVELAPGTVVVNIPNQPNVFQITDGDSSLVNSTISFVNFDFEAAANPYLQQVADETGLNEADMETIQEAVTMQDSQESMGYGADFQVTEM